MAGPCLDGLHMLWKLDDRMVIEGILGEQKEASMIRPFS